MAAQGQNEKKVRVKNQEELVQKVAERVWELWRETLRLERERRGAQRKGMR